MARRAPEIALAGVPRVNLMPRIETVRRDRLSLTRVWGIAAGAALVVALLVIAGAFVLQYAAEQQLAAEQARASDLTADLASHAEVSAALASQATIEAFRTEAMAADFAWTPLVTSVTKALPARVVLIEAALIPGTAPVGDDPAAEIGASGTMTFESVDPADQAATVAALAQVAGVKAVDAAALTSAGQDSYSFVVTIAFNQSIYSGDYAKEAKQ